MRLQKLLAAAGFGSRRDAERFLEEERVTVNGRTASLGDRADPARDDIRIDGERLRRDRPAYWIVNKPRGVVTTVRDDEGRRTVIDLLPRDVGRLFPVGRLDRETSGLLLLTNDGDVTHALLHPSLGNEREYRVTVKGDLDARAVGRLERGVTLEEGRTSPARVGPVRFDPDTGTSTFTLTLIEGRKRQIRRSLLVLGFPVRRLVRVRMGPLRIGRLGVGEARPLRSEERRLLLDHARRLRAGERPVPATPPRGPKRRPPKGPKAAVPSRSAGAKAPRSAGRRGEAGTPPSGPRGATGSRAPDPERASRARPKAAPASSGRDAKRPTKSAKKGATRKLPAKKRSAKKGAGRKTATKKRAARRKGAARPSGPRKPGGPKAGGARRQRPASSRKGTRR